MQDTLIKFFEDLFASEAFRNALITVLTTIVLIIGVKLQGYLKQLTAKETINKLSTLRNYVGDVSQDLIVNAEKRFIDTGDKKEAWVVDMLKFQFADYVNGGELTDDDLKAIVQKNYEELKSTIPDDRWKLIQNETKNSAQPGDSIRNDMGEAEGTDKAKIHQG